MDVAPTEWERHTTAKGARDGTVGVCQQGTHKGGLTRLLQAVQDACGRPGGHSYYTSSLKA
eukprot:2588084-Pyramimonas_sp.AAC.3